MNLDLLNEEDKSNLEGKNKKINDYFSSNNMDFTNPNTIKSALGNFDGILNDADLRTGVQKTTEWRNKMKIMQDDLKEGKTYSAINADNFINGENGLNDYISSKGSDKQKQGRQYSPAFDTSKLYDDCIKTEKSQTITNLPITGNPGYLQKQALESLDHSQIEDCIKNTIRGNTQARAQMAELAEYDFRKNPTPEYRMQQYQNYNRSLDNHIADYKKNIQELQIHVIANANILGDHSAENKKAADLITHYENSIKDAETSRKSIDMDLISKDKFSDHYEVMTGNLINGIGESMGYAKAGSPTYIKTFWWG